MLSVAYLKKHLRLEHTTADDMYLADLEAAAVSLIEEYEGVHYGAAGSVTEHVRGTGTPDLFLAAAPTAVTSVHEASYPGETPTEIATADDDGFLVRGARLVRAGGYVWERGYEYTVVYTRGYAPGAAPERVYQAVREIVTHWYVNDTAAGERVIPESVLGTLRRRAPRVG